MPIEVNTDSNNDININISATQTNANISVDTQETVIDQIGVVPLFGPKGDPGEAGYSPSATVVKSDNTSTITITDKDGTTTAEVNDGATGNGIQSIAKTSTAGLVDTYTVTYTDSTTTTFDVTNGADGQDGTSATITGATATIDNTTGTPSVTVTAGGTESARSFAFDFEHMKGATGNGIQSITLISTVGLTKTYRITFTDGTTFDYEVSDGASGSTSFASITGQPSDNTNLATALNAKADDTGVVHLDNDEIITGSKTFQHSDYDKQLIVKRTTSNSTSCITFSNAEGVKGYIGIDGASRPMYFDAQGNGVNIIRNSGYNTATGTTSQPIYINNQGIVTACTEVANIDLSNLNATGETYFVKPDEMYFKANDTITLSPGCPAVLTSSKSRMYITIVLPKSVAKISTITATSLVLNARHNGSYIPSANWDAKANSTLTISKISNNTIEVVCYSTTAFSGASSNNLSFTVALQNATFKFT